MAAMAATAFGREHRIDARLTYTDFQARVTPRNHDRLLPYLERTKRGEADVLWPGRCSRFCLSAGTTGPRKLLPVTAAMGEHFRRALREVLLCYTARAGHAGIFRGRHLLLGGATGLAAAGSGAVAGDWAALAPDLLPPWVDQHLYEPGPQLARLGDVAQQNEAIAQRTRSRNITVLAGQPTRLLGLIDQLTRPDGQERVRPSSLAACWPQLECVIHTGQPVAPFVDDLRRRVGPRVLFHEVLAAAEGIFAVQDGESTAGLRLLTGTGIFFEFVPVAQYHETRPEAAGLRAVPLEGVQTGLDYVLLVTTPGGLCRYVTGDVVRFVSTDPARIQWVGRTELELSVKGERLFERALTDALAAVCHRRGWHMVDFHVAPLAAPARAMPGEARHEWWIELRPGTMETPTGPTLAAEIDAELQRGHERYAARRRDGALAAPFVRLVMPGLFEDCLRRAGRWDGLSKTPRSWNDRRFADALAALAPFSAH